MSLLNGAIHAPFLWATWSIVPVKFRLALYQWLRSRYIKDTKGSVTKLPFSLALKSVDEVSPHVEADNTRFVARHTSIPVPKILDVVESCERTPDGKPLRGYIVMSWIDGQSLRQWIGSHVVVPPETASALDQLEAFRISGDGKGMTETMARIYTLPKSTLDLSDGAQLIDDLRRALTELRSIPPPMPDAVCGLNNRPLSSIRCTVIPHVIGPFHSQQAFKAAILSQVGVMFEDRLPGLRRLAEPVHAKRHCICFTHADLHPGNILVKDGRLSGIIDWEHAGWYPEYWEYTMIEYHMMNKRLVQQFWDAVHPFGEDAYRDELALEWALWGSTGDKAVHDPCADDLSCPRLVQSLDPREARSNLLRGSGGS
ncbi:kinase-like domain-containing protein [Trametes punicea]|nr:kinase-like domain-containing protein [Trametes punicea]